MNRRIRPATSKDAPRVAEVLIQARSAFMPYAPSAHSEAEVHEWVREQLVPTGGVTVAEVDDEVVGVVAVSHDGPSTWIDQMYVYPSHVNQGIGSALLMHVMQHAAPLIRLYTFQANVGARRFYERYGFQPVQFTDGQANEERCPDVLYERNTSPKKVPIFPVAPEGMVQRRPH